MGEVIKFEKRASESDLLESAGLCARGMADIIAGIGESGMTGSATAFMAVSMAQTALALDGVCSELASVRGTEEQAGQLQGVLSELMAIAEFLESPGWRGLLGPGDWNIIGTELYGLSEEIASVRAALAEAPGV